MLKVFISYSHADEKIKQKLEIHLAMLNKAGFISTWHDRKIIPGEKWAGKINTALEDSDIILFLVSPDFLASNYCYDIEVKKALQLHEDEKAVVVPVIIRYCQWQIAQFVELQCLPKDANPIYSNYWENEDAAFLNVTEGLKSVINAHNLKISKRKDLPQDQKVKFTIGGDELLIDSHILENNSFWGIDFGTSTSIISVVKWNRLQNTIAVEQLPIEFYLESSGQKSSSLIPSVLYYSQDDNNIQFGYEAKKRKNHDSSRDGVNFWSSFKMHLGKDEGDIFIDSLIKNESDYIILNPKDATRVFFGLLKERIDEYLNFNNLSIRTQICISIPASFEANQRQDLLEAVANAGINTNSYTFIDEPNAAFLNFIHENPNNLAINTYDRQYTLVFDFGAGTCDVSILEFGLKTSGFYSKNIAISKFEQLGGDDIDKKIAKKILFPQFCDSFDLEIKTISDVEYSDLLDGKLKYLAESLKITCCDQLRILFKKNLKQKNLSVLLNDSVSINLKNKQYLFESPTLCVEEFVEIMHPFIKREKNNEFSIFYVIDSALKKAKMDYKDIDNVLLVGGSCKNPLIEKSLREVFTNSNFLIPSDLQTQVSQGTAINALLSLGLNNPPIAPIVSETISLQLNDNYFLPIINEGEEIPHFKEISEKLQIPKEPQHLIEMPLFVSGNKKMLANIKITSATSFHKNDTFHITSEIDNNKMVTIKVFCNGRQLETQQISPYANEVLSTYRKAVKETEKEINNSLASGLSIHDQKVKSLVKSLITIHSEWNNFKDAMECTIKYFPSNYGDIAYYANCAGLDEIGTEYTIKAFKNDPNEISAYNLALEYSESSEEYEKYMRIAAKMGNISAKINLAQVLIKSNNPEGRSKVGEVFSSLYAKFQNDNKSMDADDYEDLLIALNLLNYTELKTSVEDSYNKFNAKRQMSANKLYNSNCLLTLSKKHS